MKIEGNVVISWYGISGIGAEAQENERAVECKKLLWLSSGMLILE